MAHEIDETLGTPAFTYDESEGGAWHGLGQPIPKEFANDPRKIAEIAGASYSVSKRPVMFPGNNGPVTIENRMAIVRDDTCTALEVLSDNKYNVVQPVQYFEAFRDSLKKSHLRISSAGVLKGGRIVFVNAKFTDHGMSVLGKDNIDTYVCLGGGYDGTLASFGYLSSFRTVCWNTLSANIAERKAETKNGKAGKGFFRIPHSAVFDGEALHAALGLAGAELQVRAEVFNTLAGRKATQAAVAEFFCKALDIDPADVNATTKDGKPKLSVRLQNQLAALAGSYAAGPGATLESANGTWWGALNAVTHYVDHMAATRDSYADGTGSARFASAQFGTGAEIKTKALRMAMANAGIGQSMLLAA